MFYRYCWEAIACALFILILSILPGPEIPDVKIRYFDKFVHFSTYAFLCFFTVRGFIRQTRFPSLKCFACSYAFIFCVIYGGILELVQHYFISDRIGDWLDFITNTAGAFVISLALAIKYKSL